MGPERIESIRQMVEVGAALQRLNVGGLRLSTLAAVDQSQSPEARLRLLSAVGRRFNPAISAGFDEKVPRSAYLDHCEMIELQSEHWFNEALLCELAARHKAVMLVRRPATPLEELVRAAELAESLGCRSVVICFSTGPDYKPAAEPAGQHLDLEGIIEVRRRLSAPVVVDSASMSRHWSYAEQVATAAAAVGADAVTLAIAPGSEHGLIEARRAVLPEQAAGIVERLGAVRSTLNALQHHQRFSE